MEEVSEENVGDDESIIEENDIKVKESADIHSPLFILPWNRGCSYIVDNNIQLSAVNGEETSPGEFVLRVLFTEFAQLAGSKIERILGEPTERLLSKSLQRGEDPQFDQLLSSLSSVAEHCLSSLLRTLFQWYERQTGKDAEDVVRSRSPTKGKGGAESPRLASKMPKEKDPLWERRDLAVEFIFCLVLIEVLKQLSLHPVEDSQIKYIENMSFRQLKAANRESHSSPMQVNYAMVTALHAEVIGVLAQTRFQSVRQRFMQEYKENQGSTPTLVNLILGLKFIRIKLFPVDELEESFLFLQECASFFLEKNIDKEVKYAFTSLFVEILLPVAATAKREYSIPAVKKFVDMLYKDVLEMAKKAKHSIAMYPLVTALLCISQKTSFLSNWNAFLVLCLNSAKSRDVKMQRMAMECIYRLVWVYVVRVKCENHAATISRLRSITDTLFPKGSRAVTPRNIPLNIFVKIIQFIAQEKLDFAMQDIIFDLLNIGKSVRQLNPERMNIGLRAFLVIADHLQRKEGAPPMPSTIGALPSGNTLKVKKTFTKLTEAAAKSIGVVTYYSSVRRALDAILRTLDLQVGRHMTMMNPNCVNKEADDMITGERKPKIDLFRACVAAIPKCVPDGMSKAELVEMVSRLTLHMDEELRGLAFAALQSLVLDFPEYRERVMMGFIAFALKEVNDTLPALLETCIRMVLQLVLQWKTAVVQPTGEGKGDKFLEMSMSTTHTVSGQSVKSSVHVLHCVEGFALVMLCQTKAMHRKLALTLLKELRTLFRILHSDKIGSEERAIDIIEQTASSVIDKALEHISNSDKASLGLSSQMDLQLLAEKSALLAEKDMSSANISRDLWSHCLAGFLSNIYFCPKMCSCCFQFCWSYVYQRLFNMYTLIDPSADFDSVTSRASISFKAPKKPANFTDICLWRNYLIFVCCTPPNSVLARTPSINVLSDETLAECDMKTETGKLIELPKLSDVLKSTVLLVRSESNEIREAAVTGLGKTVATAHTELVEEMHSLMREVLDRRAEGVRKKKKRDILRLQIARIFAANAATGCFKYSFEEAEHSTLLQTVGEYIESMRVILETEYDKDDAGLVQMRLHFSSFLHLMIKSVSPHVQRELLRNQARHNLFFLLASYCGHFNVNNYTTRQSSGPRSAELEFSSLEAMCALLCCGEVFDQKALEVSNGYLYKLLDTMLGSDNAKIYHLGQETVELMLENNEKIPAFLSWVITKCYTGSKAVSSGCFLALANVFGKRQYTCKLIPSVCVVLFKSGDAVPEVRERAAQLLFILDRRFFSYSPPFQATFSGYAYGQQRFSKELAVAHPELTLPMLSEMMLRFESTNMVGQRCLLVYMLPWLQNVELVDVNDAKTTDSVQSPGQETEEVLLISGKVFQPLPLTGKGWGSSEATQLVLNNLMYLTAKYDDYFNKEIECAWAALCKGREANVPLIIDYLIVMAGLCGTAVMAHAKKIAVYIARSNTLRTIDELMSEIRLTETVTTQWERLDSPPYYCVLRRGATSPVVASKSSPINQEKLPQQSSLDSDTDSKSETSSTISKRFSGVEQQRSSGSFGSAKAFAESVLEENRQNKMATVIEQQQSQSGLSEVWAQQWTARACRDDASAIPLPTPHEWTYFAPITLVFPRSSSPAHLYRCNFAMMLLTEIVPDCHEVPWNTHLPLMLHVCFLGLDHVKPSVHEHCKRLIINLVVSLVCAGERSAVAKALLDFQSVSNIALHRTLSVRGSSSVICDETASTDSGDAQQGSRIISPSQLVNEVRSADGSVMQLSIEDRARQLIDFLAKSDCKPLWPFEDITPKNHTIKSSEQLEHFLYMTVSLFEDAMPDAFLLDRWGHQALHWATSCSSRHYAGRSFQIFRGLHVPLTWSMLSDILQRLVESVAENSEDVQGYVLEILLTFLSEVECAFVEPPCSSIEHVLNQDKRHSIHAIEDGASLLDPKSSSSSALSAGHCRSFSTGCELNETSLRRRCASEIIRTRQSRLYGSEFTLNKSHLSGWASASAQDLPNSQVPENPLDMIARLFWISVSLLESDYEHEFLMAIRLLDSILDTLEPRRAEGFHRIEVLHGKLSWTGFPGVQALLLKGLTSPVTTELTLHLLSKLTTLSSVTVINPSQSSGLALNIIALLPKMISNFDDPDAFCKTAASRIAAACDGNASLANLGRVIQMYRDGDYSKSVHFWIEVVCKYVLDAFPQLSTTLLALLVEILELGPASSQRPVMLMICAILKYSDSSSPGLEQFNSYLLKVVTGHVKDINLWKESLNILKLVVSNSSQIHEPDRPSPNGVSSSDMVQPRGSIGSLLSLAPRLPWGSDITLAESSLSLTSQIFKKDLPGRTLEFTYNVSATPVIGAKFNRGSSEAIAADGKERSDSAEQISLATSSSSGACWRKPHGSQRRTRERLVQMLPLCGHKGGLKQSLSVIFSSSSDLAVDSKQTPSSEESSVDESAGEKPDESGFTGQQLSSIFTEFDFLDDELDDKGSEDLGAFGWTSTTELQDDPSYDNLASSRCDSEPDLSSVKDDNAYDDDYAETSRVLGQSLPASSLSVMKEEREHQLHNRRSPSPSIVIPETITPDNEVATYFRPEPSPVSVSSVGSSVCAIDRASSESPSPDLQLPDFLYISYADMPYKWTQFANSFVSNPTLLAAVDSLPFLPVVLNANSRWIQDLARECSLYFDKDDMETVGRRLLLVRDTLARYLHLPFVFIDADTFEAFNLLTRHKFIVLKLSEGLRVLQEKREQALEHLDVIQSTSARKHLLKDGTDDEFYGMRIFDDDAISTENGVTYNALDGDVVEQHLLVDLGTCLFRLLMQFVMCLEIYLSYVERFQSLPNRSQVADLSSELKLVKEHLTASCAEATSSPDSPSAVDDHRQDTKEVVSPTVVSRSNSGSEATQSRRSSLHGRGGILPVSDYTLGKLIELIENSNFKDAAHLLECCDEETHSAAIESPLRSPKDPVVRFSTHVDTIVAIYACHMLKGKSNTTAILGSGDELGSVCDKLTELVAELLSFFCDKK